MAHEDRYGLPFSTNSHEAASAYRDGVDLMLAGWTGTAQLTVGSGLPLTPIYITSIEGTGVTATVLPRTP